MPPTPAARRSPRLHVACCAALAIVATLACVAPGFAAQPATQPAPAIRLSATRADLARAYIALEHALLREQDALSDADRTLVERRFDTATMRFFTGQSDIALQELHALHRRLDDLGLPAEPEPDPEPTPEPTPDAIPQALALDDPRVLRLLSDALAPSLPSTALAALAAPAAQPQTITIRPLYTLLHDASDVPTQNARAGAPLLAEMRWPFAAPTSHTLTLGIFELFDTEPFFTAPLTINVTPGQPIRTHTALPGLREALAQQFAHNDAPRTLRLGFVQDGTLIRETSRCTITPEPLSTLRARIDDALDGYAPPSADEQVPADPLSPTPQQLLLFRTILKERAAALTEEPDEFSSDRFLADLGELSRSLLEDELPALLQHENPFSHREGEWVMPLVITDGARGLSQSVPCRVYAPPQAASRTPTPVVIALHGAGGDEAMWLHAYGAGKLKDLADTHGFIILSPSTYALTTNPRLARALLEQARLFYTIDDSRITILGHSMGAQAAVNIAWSNATTYAGCLLFAGGRPPLRPTTKGVPTLVVLGGLDPIAPADSLTTAWNAAIARPGSDIQVRTVEEAGHTLLVTTELDRAIEWLVTRQRKP